MSRDPPARNAAGDPLRRQAGHGPDAVALEDGERRWTYEVLDRGADELATRLAESGVAAGDVVGAWLDPSPAGIASVHAVSRLAGVLAPGHTRWSDAERAVFVARLRPAAVIGGPGSPPPAEGWRGRRIELSALGGVGLSLFRPSGRPEPASLPEGAHSLLWTSGSAGQPRVVCLSLTGQLHSARAANRRLGLGSGDGWLVSLGLGHVGGLAIALRSVVAGARLVLPPSRFEPDRLLRLVRSGNATHVSLVPAMLDRMIETDTAEPLPDRLRCVLVGGDATPRSLLSRALERGWPVALTYGLTEAGSQVATAPPSVVRRKPGTVGPPLDGVEIRIGADGEIRVGGPTIMLGYVEDGELSAGVLDGWVQTGDRGRLDDEGDLWVTGRITSRIVSGGSNVDPAEIEDILASHPRVRAAGVVGVPDDIWGERVVAIIVAREPSGTDVTTLGPELAAWARARLTGSRCPRAWVFVDRLPVTTTGKPDRVALRDLATLDADTGSGK